MEHIGCICEIKSHDSIVVNHAGNAFFEHACLLFTVENPTRAMLNSSALDQLYAPACRLNTTVYFF